MVSLKNEFFKIHFFPIQSFGFSIIHWKTPFASRFLDAIKNKIGKTNMVKKITKISVLPKSISLKVIAKFKILNVPFYIIT